VSGIVKDRNLIVASILSGNRNFEGRIQSQVRANYLASPPLVVAYALAGRMQVDLTTEPIGEDSAGQPVSLKDIWPSEREIQEAMLGSVRSEMFREQYAHVFDGDERWRSLPIPTGERRLDVYPQSAVLRGHHRRADLPDRHSQCARARGARRQCDDRSHLPGGIDSR
jgi:aconitate hydratase A / 2-methylisocitrate dehydratase